MKAIAFILLTTTNIWAITMSQQACISLGKTSNNLKRVTFDCYEFAKNDAKVSDTKIHGDKKFISWNNLLFIESSIIENGKNIKVVNVIRGNNTKIKSIKAYEISHDGKEIYILNENGGEAEILVFLTNRGGNVKPRIISSPSLIDISTFSLSEDGKYIYVVSNDKLIRINAKADIRHDTPNRYLHEKVITEGKDFSNSSHIIYHSNNIYILDHSSHQINIYSI